VIDELSLLRSSKRIARTRTSSRAWPGDEHAASRGKPEDGVGAPPRSRGAGRRAEAGRRRSRDAPRSSPELGVAGVELESGRWVVSRLPKALARLNRVGTVAGCAAAGRGRQGAGLDPPAPEEAATKERRARRTRDVPWERNLGNGDAARRGGRHQQSGRQGFHTAPPPQRGPGRQGRLPVTGG